MPPRKTYRKKTKKAVTMKNVTSVVKKSLIKIQQEHFHDFQQAAPFSTTTGIFDALVIAQGDTDVTREGDEIILKSLKLNYEVLPGLAQTQSACVRVMILQWYDNTAPLVGAILQNSGVGSGPTSHYAEDYNRRNHTNKVLYDKCHIVAPLNSGQAGAVVMNKYIKGFKKNIMFEGGNNSPIDGDIYLVTVTDLGANPPLLNLQMRAKWINN